MNASVTMRQAGQSKKMAEVLLSFEERKTILKWYLKCVYVFLALSVFVRISFIEDKRDILRQNVFYYIAFHETCNGFTALHGDLLQRISPKLAKKYEHFG
jgi:hypothetical protein